MTDDDRLDRLESLVEDQQETIERQRERLDRLETERADAEGEAAEEDSGNADRSSSAVSRRGVLHGLGLAGLVGLGAGTASAAEPRGVAGSGDHPVDTLYLDTLSGPVTGGADLTTLDGDGLAIEDGTLATEPRYPSVADSGNLRAENPTRLNFEDNVDVVDRDDEIEISVSDSNTQTDVSDDGTEVVRGTHDIDFGDNLDVTDDGDGSATVDADVQGATNWEDGGSNLLTTSSPFTGIDVEDLEVADLVVANLDLTGSTTIDHGDLDATGSSDHHVRPSPGHGLAEGSGAFDVDPAQFAGDNLSADGNDLVADQPENVVVVAKSGGDYTSVNDALRDVSGPAVVWVAPGEYDITSLPATEITDGVSLVGAGRSSTVLYVTDGPHALKPTGAETEIRSLTLDWRSGVGGFDLIQNTSSNLFISDVEITESGGSILQGIEVSSGKIKIENSSVRVTNESSGNGIDIIDGTVTARECVFEGASNGILVDVPGTANIANSQVINGISSPGTVNQFGNYDGSYNEL